jgi:hypothetical protein
MAMERPMATPVKARAKPALHRGPEEETAVRQTWVARPVAMGVAGMGYRPASTSIPVTGQDRRTGNALGPETAHSRSQSNLGVCPCRYLSNARSCRSGQAPMGALPGRSVTTRRPFSWLVQPATSCERAALLGCSCSPFIRASYRSWKTDKPSDSRSKSLFERTGLQAITGN